MEKSGKRLRIMNLMKYLVLLFITLVIYYFIGGFLMDFEGRSAVFLIFKRILFFVVLFISCSYLFLKKEKNIIQKDTRGWDIPEELQHMYFQKIVYIDSSKVLTKKRIEKFYH
ncbi:hypothetical protein IGI52_003405 [Enterococcus sp. DIV0187]